MIQLYPYQSEGRDFLASRKKAMCCDTMGLGKTAQAITASDKIGATRILVICPAGVRHNWHREFKRFSTQDHQYTIISSGKDKLPDTGVILISYELATRKAFHHKLMTRQFDVLILDESHFLKSRDAKRTEAIYGVHCKGLNGLISRANHTWALTGTPTPNHPGEIFSVLRAFGVWTQNYWAFEARFCEVTHGDWGATITGMKNVEELKQLVKPIMIRRKVEEVMSDLPPVTISDMVVSAEGVANEVDLKEWREAEYGEEGKRLKSRIESTADELKLDISNLHLPTLRRLTGITKVKPICELIARELDAGLPKIVIFAEHRDVIEEARGYLNRYGSQVIYGGNTPEVKEKRLQRFMTMWKYRVLIGHIKTLGTGIDGLQNVANHGVFIESSWTPSDNLQAIGRLRRNGQKNPVFIRFAALADSLDEHIQRVNRRKTQMIAQLLD